MPKTKPTAKQPEEHNLIDDEESQSQTHTIPQSTANKLKIVYYVLWVTLWALLYILFIELQFGTVYLISSGLIAMYLNTRTGPKQPDEVSAYSVFNDNCQSIDGTLKAEQFEREIRFGAGSVR